MSGVYTGTGRGGSSTPPGVPGAPPVVDAGASPASGAADPVRVVRRATRLQGQVRVPGEWHGAAQALWLAALSEGDSRVTHVPPAAASALEALEALGVGLQVEGDTVVVHGAGLRGLSMPGDPLHLDGPAAAVLPALAILSQQAFACRVRLGPGLDEPALGLLRLLARTGAAGAEEDGLLRFDGVEQPVGAAHDEADLSGPVKLALLTAGLYGDGPTVVREPIGSRDRAEARLRARGVSVEGSRQAGPALRTITLTPGESPRGLDVDLAGDLELALPFLVAGLVVRRAEVRVQRVVLRPAKRALVDMARQIGGVVELADHDDGSTDLVVQGSGRLKATRVAGKRAAAMLRQVPLLAVLATQTEGEFILRDLEVLRQGAYDLVDHLASQLRRMGVKLGEYPYGLVIDGARPLTGTRVETRRHAGVAQAFAVAGLVAQGQTEIEDAHCVDAVFPGFFEALEALRPTRKKEDT